MVNATNNEGKACASTATTPVTAEALPQPAQKKAYHKYFAPAQSVYDPYTDSFWSKPVQIPRKLPQSPSPATSPDSSSGGTMTYMESVKAYIEAGKRGLI